MSDSLKTEKASVKEVPLKFHDITKDEIIKEEGYINRHGLIKTIYNSNSLKNEYIEGVLIMESFQFSLLN